MTLIYAILLLLVTVGPIYLAWAKGDIIITQLENRRRRRRLMARLRRTRRLPVGDDVVQRLLMGDANLEKIEERIAGALQRLSLLPVPAVGSRSASADPHRLIQEMEAPLLRRESHFGTFLDTAWLQSESIEVMAREVDLLRQMAGLPKGWPETDPGSRTRSAAPDDGLSSRITTGPGGHRAPTPAAEKLMQNLRQVAQRRQTVDQRIRSLGSEEPNSG